MATGNRQLYGELMRATARGDDKALETLIPRAKAEGTLTENLLRLGLQNACKKGKAAAARLLLQEGAPTDLTGTKGSPALFWAVTQPQTKGHLEVTALLLSKEYLGCPADKEWRDENGRTIFMGAAWRGHNEALKLLISDGANINSTDVDDRTVLHNLAFDKRCRWDEETIRIILDQDINIESRDNKSRTALHWAAATSKPNMVAQILTRSKHESPNVNARTSRGKTALHLACRASPPMPAIVDMLLSHGADARFTSDGNWTCLHNTARRQLTEEVVELILEYEPSLINARTSTGMTPLHVAAQFGNVHAASKLLSYADIKLNAKDSFYMTPMLRAAQGQFNGPTQGRFKDIVELLSPYNESNIAKLTPLALHACDSFKATIVDFRANTADAPLVDRRTITDVLYTKDVDGSPRTTTNVHSIKRKPGAKPRFRWIHLPANNMAWAEALIAKAFLEGGARDVQGLKALERAFSEQHRGEQYHSSFMRPLCQRAERGIRDSPATRSTSIHPSVRLSVGEAKALQESSPERANTRDRRRRRTEYGPGLSAAPEILPRINGSPAPLPSPRPESEGADLETRKSGSDAPAEVRVDEPLSTPPNRRPDSPRSGKQKRRAKRTPSGLGIETNASGLNADEELRPLQPTRTQSFPLSEISVRTGDSHPTSRALPGSNVFLFMPYLHFETDEARREMSATVRSSAPKREDEVKRPRKRNISRIRNRWSRDEMLIHAYLHSTTGLHLRRTLDQFYLHGIDTSERDEDQVVWRYCRSKGKEEKVFMVDQLWMWILGPSLIITCFPDRWNQPKNDPLNVLDGIIEDINAKAGRPVETVHDLALIVTGRCAGSFDRHKPGDEDYQFLDMFESSIGNVNSQETDLYNRFYDASRKVHDWLRASEQILSPTPSHRYPKVVDRFLDIGEETRLLKEIKDIRDELNMIGMVLHQQRSVMEPLCNSICEDLSAIGGGSGGSRNHARTEVKRRVDDQARLINRDIGELERMGKLANDIQNSLINLLDLKQKQSNAFEARFARDQAADTVRQGKTILIFTVVTILFLPVSFMAQFFTINISQYQRDASNNLQLSYVAKYIFGIGLAISVFIILAAFTINPIGSLVRGMPLQELLGGGLRKQAPSAETLATSKRRLSVGGDAPVRMNRLSHDEKRSMASDYSSIVDTNRLRVPEVMSSTSPVSFRLRGRFSQDLERG